MVQYNHTIHEINQIIKYINFSKISPRIFDKLGSYWHITAFKVYKIGLMFLNHDKKFIFNSVCLEQKNFKFKSKV